jgi:tetratricopeptide (TPR) repeat protein
MSRSRLYLALFLLSAALAPACGRGNADDHVRKGDEYVELGRLPEAIIEYRAALQLESNRGDIRLKLADAYVRHRDLGEAYRESMRAADLLPNDATAQFRAGTLLLVAGEFEDAKTRAEKAVALDPKNSHAQILLGNALAGLRDLDAAIGEYEDAIAIDPGAHTAYDNIAILQWAKGKKTEAEVSFRKAVEVAPKSSEARMALANFLWSTGRMTEAEQTLKEALAIDPKHVGANRALGFFYIASNRAAEAEEYFEVLARNAKSVSAAMALADYYLLIRKPDEARKALLELAARDPAAYAAATTRLAALDVALGERTQAAVKLRQVLEKHPKEAPARLLNARLLLMDGKRDEAFAEAGKIIADQPNAPVAATAHAFIGAIHSSEDRRGEAIKSYQEVLRLQARPVVAHLALTALYLADGAVDKAAASVQAALTAAPGNLLARTLSVRVASAQGNRARADQELAALQKEYPTAPVVLKLLAEQQAAGGNAAAARETYIRLSQLAPNDLEVFTGLVRLELARGNMPAVLRTLDEQLRVNEPTTAFLVFAAETYAVAGREAKAEELLRKVIEREPKRLPAYELLGRLYLKLKRLDEAEEQFTKIIERNPNSVSAHTMLGMLYEVQRRLPEAEAQYQHALRADARAVVAANNLAWLYVASNRNLDEALKLAQVAHQQLPDSPNVNDTLGWIYYRKNIPSVAVRHLEVSVEKKSDDPASHYHLGMAYAQLGEIDKARKSLERALSLNAAFDGAPEARQKLAQLGG